MLSAPTPPVPEGWQARSPEPSDVRALTALRAEARLAGGGEPASAGEPAAELEMVTTLVAGAGSWTRRHLVAGPVDEEPVAWVTVHDRAAGRTIVDLALAGPDRVEPAAADAAAAGLLEWAADTARRIGAQRGLRQTQLDAGALTSDERVQRWLSEAGYTHVRTWLQMSRPVQPGDAPAPLPRPGVVVRQVARHESGVPVAADLQAIHLVLEESFADHFNSYRESFPEFVARLREDPGHRWAHWWLAEVDMGDGEVLPGGAVIGTVSPADTAGIEGSYVDYIGVHRRSRGRGVAKALLAAVVADAAERGRNRVGLEVDADSPTGADGLYTSLGWSTTYRTQSWHRDLTLTG